MIKSSSFNSLGALCAAMQYAPPSAIKRLNQEDRKVVRLALIHMRTHLAFTPQPECYEERLINHSSKWEEIARKLNEDKGTPQPRSWFIVRILKGIWNLLFRTSSDAVIAEQKALNHLTNPSIATMTYRHIMDGIQKNENELTGLKEAQRFLDEEAGPEYEALAEFYRGLPIDLNSRSLNEEGRKHVQQQIEHKRAAVAKRLETAEKDKRDPSYLHVLKKEILFSLNKMCDYEKEDLPLQLKVAIGVFQNAATSTKQRMEKAIRTTQRKLEHLRYQKQLWTCLKLKCTRSQGGGRVRTEESSPSM